MQPTFTLSLCRALWLGFTWRNASTRRDSRSRFVYYVDLMWGRLQSGGEDSLICIHLVTHAEASST